VYAEVLEPLVASGAVRPLVVVGVEPGGYLGDRKAGEHDVKKDLRAMEYLPTVEPERFARHERFFCEEVVPWAEAEFGASKDRAERAVFGCSNGARFAVEMGLRRPGLFGHVIALSVAGGWDAKAKPTADGAPRYHLAAGIWEKAFHGITTKTYDALKAAGVPVTFTSRVSGHDDAMWQEEFAAAVKRAWGKG
jgi:enterochelin esterase-like enzyme